MKKLFSILLISISFSCYSQGIKISQLPVLPTTNLDSVVFAVVYSGVTYKMPGYYLKGYGTDDSLAITSLVQIDSFHIMFCRRNSTCDTLVGVVGDGGATLTVARGIVYKNGQYQLADTVNGAATKFQWLYDKAAFRAGSFNSTQADIGNVGQYSFASGQNTTASQFGAIAMGTNVTCSGSNAVGMGTNINVAAASSFAAGSGVTITGQNGFAAGAGSTVSGTEAVAFGNSAVAAGRASFCVGFLTVSKSFGGAVVGHYNDSTDAASSTTVQPGNRLFQIGNGSNSTTARNNAMTVLKSGFTLINNLSTYGTDPAAALDVRSTTSGFLPPRMTKTQRDAISSPPTGTLIYQTDNTPGIRVYNGTNWMRFTETAD